MRFYFYDNISESNYRDFLKKQKAVSQMQDPAWAIIKDNWSSAIIGGSRYPSSDGELNIEIGSLALIRNLPMGYKLVYLPRGPVGDLSDCRLVRDFAVCIKKWAKSINAICVTADPYVINNYEEGQIDKDFGNDFNETIRSMQLAGFLYGGKTYSMEDTNQPRLNLSLSLLDDNMQILSYEKVVKKASSKKRPQLRKGYHDNRGVVIQRFEGNDIDVERLSKILAFTEERQHISLRNAKYFAKFVSAFGNKMAVYFGIMDVERYMAFIQGQIDAGEGKIETNKNKLEDLNALKVERGNMVDIAAALVYYPDKVESAVNVVEYLYAGADLDLYPSLNVPSGIISKIIEESIDRGYDYVNLGGVEFDEHNPLYKYKAQFGTNRWEFVGEFTLIVNKPMYMAYKKLLPQAKKIIKNPLVKKIRG